MTGPGRVRGLPGVVWGMALALGACAVALARPAPPVVLHGTVSHVSDGDTVWLRTAPEADAFSVRLVGLDAPEICQAGGPQARDALAGLLLHRTVRLEAVGHDSYGRVLGRIDLQGQDAGRWMVSQGLAWSYHSQRSAGPYGAEEARARARRQGLWQDAAPLPPRDFRRQHGSCHPSAPVHGHVPGHGKP